MPSTKMMMMSLNQAQPAGDRYSVSSASSGRSTDQESRPSTACSSTDMCTPMPNSTFRNFDAKSFSTASECSFTSAPFMRTASPDTESVDSPAHKPSHPVTPPSPRAQGARANTLPNKRLDDAALHATMQSWQGGDCLNPAGAQLSEPDALYHRSAEQAPTYNAFSAWRPQAATHQSSHDYRRLAGAFMGGPSGHSRSASYQSTASSDSWNSRGLADPNSPLSGYSAGLAASMAQMSFSPLSNHPVTGTGLYPAAAPNGLKNDAFPSPHPAPKSTGLLPSADDTRNLVNSLASLTGAYQPPQVGYGGQPMMDPQALMAYTAAFGAPPLMDFYSFTPELLAARTHALAQLATAAGLNYAPPQHVEDDGPSPANKKTNLYKTELCRSWEEKGTCRYGSKCQFAHGQEELKNVSRHPKFKTEICRTFWLHGSCPYGKRCCFLHTTATESGVPPAPSTHDPKEGTQAGRNAHDPPTSRLQQRLSSGTSSANVQADKTFGASLSGYLSSSPQLQSAPATRALSDIGDMGHSRSNSSSSCSRSSDGSSRIDNLRIQIGSRFGTREQVPPQDAPAPRSRLERLRPTGDYFEATSSMPSTSTATSTRYSPFLDRPQPPHSAFSDILARSSSQHISKARSANGDGDSQWPSSRLGVSSTALI